MTGSLFFLPFAATMDLQYRLPPPQQVLFSPAILVSLVLIAIAIVVVLLLYRRSRAEAMARKRREDLQLARKLLFKRGGSDDDYTKVEFIFNNYPRIDPAATVMIHDYFTARFRPVAESTFDKDFAGRVEKLYFPPPKDTNAIAKEKNLKKLVADTKNVAENQAVAAMIDLMDATLRPGSVLRMNFEGVEGSYDCMVMNYNMQLLNVTLPANHDQLVASLVPGLKVEGSFETGPSLMAFTSSVLGVVAGSMPFCRLTIWRNAWEVRKRDSVRLGISVDVDFQHISTTSNATFKLSQIDKEIGAVRPGRLVDLSLGGGCLDTPSKYAFNIGDFVRFTASLIPGHPPATLLGSIVDIGGLNPEENDGMLKRLHIQFLALDDVSQRLLARAMRQLQENANQEEWLASQRLLEQMRRNNIPDAGMIMPAGGLRGNTGAAKKGAVANGKSPGTRSVTGIKGTRTQR